MHVRHFAVRLVRPLGWFVRLLGGRQSARSLHFLGLVAFLVFIVIHLSMVFFWGWGELNSSMKTFLSALSKTEYQQLQRLLLKAIRAHDPRFGGNQRP